MKRPLQLHFSRFQGLPTNQAAGISACHYSQVYSLVDNAVKKKK
jgi:hypothetical protein